jgi:hypothetical protein
MAAMNRLALLPLTPLAQALAARPTPRQSGVDAPRAGTGSAHGAGAQRARPGSVGRGVVLALLLAPGCKVVDAPDTLEDVVVYGFEHYDEEDPEYLVATHVEMEPLVEANLEALDEGYRVSNLTSEHLEAAGIEDAEVAEIIGAMGVADYTHGLDDVIAIVTHEHKDELFDNFLAYEVTDGTDRDCFLSRECLTLEQDVTETTEIALLGEATRSFHLSFRWVELEDGTWVVFNQSLCPDEIEFSTNIARIYQQYAFVAIYPNGDTARRVESFWVDAEVIGMDVPDTFAVDNAVGQMKSTAEKVDEAIDAGS